MGLNWQPVSAAITIMPQRHLHWGGFETLLLVLSHASFELFQNSMCVITVITVEFFGLILVIELF